MPVCPNGDDSWKAFRSATGDGNPTTRRQSGGDYDTGAAGERARKRAERAAAVDATSTAGAANGPTGQPVTPGDRVHIRTQSKFIRGLIDKADNYIQKRIDNWNDAKTYVTGLSQGEVSRWLNFTNTVARYFVNERAAMNKWIWAYARDPKLAPFAQRLAQMFDTMPNKIRALNNDFSARQNKLLDTLRPLSRRTGYKTLWLADALGHYANMVHIPEANAELLRSWNGELNTLNEKIQLAKNAQNPSAGLRKSLTDWKKRSAELRNRIKMLSDNLENPTKPDGIYSAGYTNAEARNLMQDILKATGATKAEADAFAKALSGEFNYILQKRVEAGMVKSEVLRVFPDFKNYVALLSRNENLQGAVNDAKRFDPGSYHRREGMRDTPDSALSTLSFFANRAATEIGMQEFATHLHALKSTHTAEFENAFNGLHTVKYNKLIADLTSGDITLQDRARNILDSGGLVLDVPVTTKTGATEFERQYLWFSPDWQGKGGLTGRMLNDAISSNYKIGSKPIETLGRLTSLRGQLYTRFSLGFAPLGGTRDGMERVFHMINRSYFAADGSKVNTPELIKRYIFNTPRAMKMIAENLFGNPENASPLARQYWNEFNEQGLLQKYIPGVRGERQSLAETLASQSKTSLPDLLKNPQTEFLNKWVESAGDTGRKALGTLEKWNDYWQNIAAFDQFMTLREMGVSASQAGRDVFELMNMQQKGTLTPYLRIISPFVTPTVQSAQAMARTLGLGAPTVKDIFKQGKAGWLGVLGGYVALSALYDVAAHSMGEDEDGNSRFDAIPVRTAVSFLPIPVDGFFGEGTYAKFPIGFGPVRLAAVLALGTDRVKRGLMEPEELAAEVLFTTAKDVVPASTPQFDFREKPWTFISQLLAPDIIKPFIEAGTNTNYFGSEIANAPREGVARADQGRTSTDVFWHKVAQYFARNGIVDAPPEHYAHLAKSYGAGPIRLIGNVFNAITDSNDNPTSANFDPDGYDELNSWLRAFGGTMWIGRSEDISRGKFYDYKRELNNKIMRAGVDLTSPENKGKPELAEAYRAQALEESGQFTPEEIADYELIRAADKELTALNKDFNAKYKNTWYNMENTDEVREVFRELDAAKREIYKRVVQQVNYYRSRG